MAKSFNIRSENIYGKQASHPMGTFSPGKLKRPVPEADLSIYIFFDDVYG
jgi:hypothetical protein